MAHFDTQVWPTCLGCRCSPVPARRLGVGVSRLSPLIDVIDAWLEDAPVVVGGGKWATWRGPPDPSRVVQSLWSGAAAAVHRLACPRPVSGRVGSNDRVDVADVVVTHVVVIGMRRSPAGGQPERPAQSPHLWSPKKRASHS